eukprot:Gregarina_sp_Poly_1__2447@NODE_165_length_12211_cov_32_860425_g147_i0_p1_GENE_NODE_165_length_12211_cov_32_860425_g147_i0NODE_165_length_12211_cov_32_860425_g147_i0_p1_ORF_typecomplete_len2244_score275_43EFhand_8/PF13833_6/40EFhand_8/PF13833_6/8_2e03EFhand_8/PF13833_6/0_0052EFhand_7/PF13499_6/1_2e02EFhand_7/PF13499_6/0_54EFhand_1/PF00036_32/16EFhand_1/PF00036_32/0_51EFhand_10/PF14788_6/4_6e02EFhand_10/PF14788_6/1_6e03EFhand_10/PF14788_6/0_41SPARC_Ca_bdg/PF10591_9/7_2e02SPARC_Ca_bdg/PF10591_9/1_3
MRTEYMKRKYELSAIPLMIHMNTSGIGESSGTSWGTITAIMDASCLKKYEQKHPSEAFSSQCSRHLSKVPLFPHFPQSGNGQMLSQIRQHLEEPLVAFNTEDADNRSMRGSRARSREMSESGGMHFINICPGMTLLNGKDFEIEWGRRECSSKCVYLYLYDLHTRQPVTSLAQGKGIPNTGSYFWAVDIALGSRESHAVVYLIMTLEPYEEGRKPRVIAVSHTFFVVKTLLLTELEYAYACFCRSYDLEMEHITERLLVQNGFTVSNEAIRICPDLRRPLPFEKEVPCVHTPGQCMVSSTTRLVVFRPVDAHAFRRNQLSHSEVFKSITRNVQVIHNVMIDPDPFYWLHSHDIPFLRMNCFLGSHLPYGLILAKTALTRTREQIITMTQTPGMGHSNARRTDNGDALWASNSPRVRSTSKDSPTGTALSIFAVINPRHLLSRRMAQNLSSMSVMFNRQESRNEYDLRRFLCYEVWGQISWIPRWWIVFWTLHVIDLQVIGFCFVLNAIITAYTQRYHRDITAIYFSDFFFDMDLSFFTKCPQPYPFMLMMFAIDFVVKWGGLLFAFRSGIYSYSRETAMELHLLCLLSYSVITALTMAILPMFLLWFLVAALIDTNGCLPSAIMCAASFYILQTVWKKYTYARTYISDYIVRNTSTLLSMVLDAWFETNGIVYTDSIIQFGKSDTEYVFKSLSKNLVLNLKNEIRKIRVRAGYLGNRIFEETSGNEFVTPEDVCFYKFKKVVPTSGTGIWYDRSGVPQGLDMEPSVALGARFATIRDYECHSRLFQSMLLGYEAAMLQDGILNGPRLGYRIDAPPQPYSCFAFAIAAEPVYPQPRLLNLSAKAGLVFMAFDKDGDHRLKEIEFCLWQEILGKPFQSRAWAETVLHYNAHYRCNATVRDGFSLTDLRQYYVQRGEAEVDADYTRLFSIMEHEELLSRHANTSTQTVDMESNDSGSDGEDFHVNEENPNQNDREQDEHALSTESQRSRATQEITEKLRNSVTARKLNVVFQYLTREQTKEALGRLTDPDVLARNFFYAQSVLLAPTVGEHFLLGLASSRVEVEDLSGEPQLKDGQPSTGGIKSSANAKALQNWTKCVCLTYEDTFLRLAREISKVYTQIFNPENVRRGINDFFDKVMAEKIQFKALRLTDSSIVLAPGDIHPSHVPQLFRFPAKTARHSMRALNPVWTTNAKVLTLAALAAMEPSKMYELGVITECLLTIGLLKISETVLVQAKNVPTGFEPIHYRVPRQKSCEDLLLRSLAEAVRVKGFHLKRNELGKESIESMIRRIVIHVDMTIQILVTHHLPFPAFILLIQLLGVSLTDDELPTTSNETPQSAVGSEPEPLDEGDEDFECWRDFLADVADIPSLKPRLLNILTEDEVRELRVKRDVGFESIASSYFSADPKMERDEVDGSQVKLLRVKKARFTRNIHRIRRIFDQISQCSAFLPSELADEAVFLLFDYRLSLSGTRACLKYLAVDSPDPLVGKPLAEAFRFPNPDESTIVSLQDAPDNNMEKLDWTYYRHSTGWSSDIIESYKKLTLSSPGFIGKSQILEFIRLLEAKYFTGDHRFDRLRWHQAEEPTKPDFGAGWASSKRAQNKKESQLNEWQTIVKVMVTPDIFHRVTSNLKICVSRQHSTLFWYLVCYEIGKTEFEAFIPAAQVCGTFTRILFQPITTTGSKYFGAALSDIHDFGGCLPSFSLSFLLRAMGLDIQEKHVQNIWADLPKDGLCLRWCLGQSKMAFASDESGSSSDEDYMSPSKGENKSSDRSEGNSVLSSTSTQSKDRLDQRRGDYLLRIDMDPTGLDPTRGTFVSFKTLRRHLTDMLLTGLPPEGLSIFVRLACNLEVDSERMEAMIDRYKWALNRYGMFKPQALVPMLCTLHVEGVSFQMLRSIVDQMRLRLPERDVKRMFDLMDTNQNRYLELGEILFGFEMLCRVFIPDHIISLLSYDPYSQLRTFLLTLSICLIIFAFLGFTVNAFSGNASDSLGESMQTLLAVVGAIAFRTSTRSNDPELDQQILSKMITIFGDDFEKRFAEAMRPEIVNVNDADDNDITNRRHGSAQMRLKYVLPRRHIPGPSERIPCAIFYVGDEVSLEPVLTGHGGDVKRLLWNIVPRFPHALGLQFHTDTGAITGQIGGTHEEILKRGISAKMINLKRTTFVITCRHPNRATAKFYLTLRILDRPVTGATLASSAVAAAEQDLQWDSPSPDHSSLTSIKEINLRSMEPFDGPIGRDLHSTATLYTTLDS